MSKFSFGNGQYVVYARSEQGAREVIGQELKRFDSIKSLMANLLTENGQAWKNFVDNASEDRLNIHFNDEQSAIYDVDATAKGEVRHQRNEDGNALVDENGLYKYELAYRYPEIEGHDANFRLAHEMGHLMLNASNPQRQGYDKTSNSRQVSGLIRRDESTNQFYGTEMQENAINLIAQLAIRGEEKADDIITGKADLSEFNSYKRCDDLVKLLAVSMRNDFDKEMSFEQLVESKLDSLITHSDGTQEPANTFFYGILNDSSMIQNEFDKYMGEGAWRQVNDAFSQLYKGNISQERFDLIFQSTQEMIQEFANIRYQEKYKETIVRNGGFNVPNLENKLEMISEITGIENQRNDNVAQESSISQRQEIEMPEGYSINEFGEIIRPAPNESEIQTQNQEQGYRQTRFEAVIEPMRDMEQSRTTGNQNEDKLTLKQKVARFLQKNNIFMNLAFVENFVHRQLDVLPPTTQETRESTVNRARVDFLNKLSNNGKYRNLPPIQRMSDPQRLEQMRRKIEQAQQTSDDNERE